MIAEDGGRDGAAVNNRQWSVQNKQFHCCWITNSSAYLLAVAGATLFKKAQGIVVSNRIC